MLLLVERSRAVGVPCRSVLLGEATVANEEGKKVGGLFGTTHGSGRLWQTFDLPGAQLSQGRPDLTQAHDLQRDPLPLHWQQ